MTVAQRTAIARRLQAVRDEALGKMPARIEPNRSDQATAGVADEDAQALNEMHQVLASTRNLGKAQLIASIDAAIHRLASEPDLFGVCEDCEDEISWARLEAVPHATLCIECQAKRDPQRNQRRRSSSDFSR
jgi:DnaK suppressor protein